MHRNLKHNFGHQRMSRLNVHVNCQAALIAQLKFMTFKVWTPILNSIALTVFCMSGFAPAPMRYSTTTVDCKLPWSPQGGWVPPGSRGQPWHTENSEGNWVQYWSSYFECHKFELSYQSQLTVDMYVSSRHSLMPKYCMQNKKGGRAHSWEKVLHSTRNLCPRVLVC